MNNINPDLLKLEKWEFHYFNEIDFLLSQDVDKMLKGLNSKDKIKDDWLDKFSRIDKKRQNSDFARGAERVYFWLFNQLGIPNSSPIGSDLMFETYNAFIHIDIKTAKISNTSDYKGKIPISENQTSYQSNNFSSNLPFYYNIKKPFPKKKYCFTYVLNVIYGDEKDNFKIIAILLIAIPNGKLKKIYGDKIIGAGKNKGKSFRFEYKNSPYFKTLDKGQKKKRVKFIYKQQDFKENDITSLFPPTST